MPIRLKKDQIEILEKQGLIPSKNNSTTTASRKSSKTRMVKKINPELFKAAAKAHGLPDPIPEYHFMEGRKWAFDWLFQSDIQHPGGRRRGWLYERVAVEIQGGLFAMDSGEGPGRHTRGAALLKEYEKLNMAQILGYKVLLVTHEQVESGEALSLVKRALHGE